MKWAAHLLIIAVSVAFAFRGGSVPEARYDGSAGSVWLDRFLAEGGVSYSAFLSELSLFEAETGRGWGRRPSTWRWAPRMREWERMVPEMEGLANLLGRLDLEWSQHAYLDALTAYVDYNRTRIRSTYGLDDRRTRFFENFAGTGPLFLNDAPDADYESLDLVSWAVGEIRAMLSPDQMESAADIVSSGAQMFRPGRY
ncbi:MAG: hypothetical protein R6V62_03290 [Candidatus Fermentibacteraceae bacterium]